MLFRSDGRLEKSFWPTLSHGRRRRWCRLRQQWVQWRRGGSGRRSAVVTSSPSPPRSAAQRHCDCVTALRPGATAQCSAAPYLRDGWSLLAGLVGWMACRLAGWLLQVGDVCCVLFSLVLRAVTVTAAVAVLRVVNSCYGVLWQSGRWMYRVDFETMT